MTTGPHIRIVLWKAAKAVEKVDRASIAQTGHVLSDFTIMEALLHPSDGRCFYVHLTKKGRHMIKKSYAKHEKTLEKIASVLSDSERKELVRLLKKIGLFAESLESGTT